MDSNYEIEYEDQVNFESDNMFEDIYEDYNGYGYDEKYDFCANQKCIDWYNQTSNLIREEKWEELVQPGNCLCSFCNSLHRIEKMFIKEGKFSTEAQTFALYLNKNNKLEWMDAIICSPPLTMKKLKDVIETGLIDVNYSSYNSLAGTFLNHDCHDYVPYWKEALDYLFSKGCSPNIQDNDGYSLLMCANAGWNTWSSLHHNYHMTLYLLEKGADPFLEDKKGNNMISYAKEFFSKKEQKHLFQVIKKYS